MLMTETMNAACAGVFEKDPESSVMLARECRCLPSH
jgi:hypothetical protein